MKITTRVAGEEQTLEVDADIKFALWLLENFSEHCRKGDTVTDLAKRVMNFYVCKDICRNGGFI